MVSKYIIYVGIERWFDTELKKIDVRNIKISMTSHSNKNKLIQ